MKMVGGLHLRAAVLAALILVPAGARADQDAPSGAAPGGPRSRLTLAGSFETNAYRQKNFFLGSEIADTTASGYFGDKNGHWTQRLDLFPRLILADNLNVNLAMALAHGVWGLDASTAGVNRSGVTNLFNNKSSFFALQVDWAYLAYRNSWTKTRWYLGRQAFGMGNLLSLDMDATGLQLYRDLGGSLAGVGYAKVSEGGGLSERDGAAVPDTIAHPRTGPDSRDADLLFAEYRMGSEKGAFHLNPFVLRYSDKNTADSVAYLPDMQGYLDARFRPQVSQATVLGLAGHVKKGIGRLDFEGNLLKGKDKIRNRNSGILQLHDRNNGDLKGMNILGRVTFGFSRLQVGGVAALGSGDDSLFSGDGNFNYLRNQGHFSLTEVWGHGLALDERGLVPEGLGNPFTRGYRGLENTRLFQGNAAYNLRSNVRLSASYSMIRASKALYPWKDLNGDGFISPGRIKVDPAETDSVSAIRDDREYGRDYGVKRNNYPGLAGGKAPRGAANDLGTEIDAGIDWTLENNIVVSLKGGMFSPGTAAGYLINGTAKNLETVTQIRLGVRVPIREFSLGG